MGKRIFNHLPADVVEEILLKLPLKSVLRFKCISKLWRSSIRSKVFITEHLNKSKSCTDFTNHNLIFNFPQSSDSPRLGSFSIGSLLNDGDEPINPSLRSDLYIPIPGLQDNNPLRNSVMDLSFLGSCNGLILINVSFGELYLWNPSTRKAKNILNASFPQEITPCHKYWRRSGYGYGFGYDESTDDYKVVSIFSCLKPPFQTQMYMYSSRTQSWKKIRNFDKGSLSDCPAKFVNGKLHWLTNRVEEDDDDDEQSTGWYIVSLDFVEEKYQIASLTHDFSDRVPRFLPVLEDLGGYLSLVCYKHGRRSMDVWVMEKEYWSKIWTFSDIGYLCLHPKPLWLKKNGDIVVAIGSHVVIYRGEDKLRQFAGGMFNARIESIVYVQSLVSPFGDNDEQLCQ